MNQVFCLEEIVQIPLIDLLSTVLICTSIYGTCCSTNKEVESTLPLCHGQRTICLKEGYNPNEYHECHLAGNKACCL